MFKKSKGVIISGWIIFIYSVFLYFWRGDILWLSIGETLFRFFLLFLFFLINAALGRKILNWSGFKINSFLESLLFELAIGLGIFTYLIIGLGIIGLLYRWTVNLAVLGIFFFTYQEIEDIVHIGKSKLKNHFNSKLSLFNIALILILFIQIIINLAGASTLPSSWDGLGEHLAMSKEWLRLHRLTPIPYVNYVQWGGPFNIGILYGAAMLIKDAILAKLIHFTFGLLTGIAIYTLGERYFSAKVGLLSVVVFSTIPIVAYMSTVAYVDLGFTFYAFLAFYAFINWSVSKKRSWLIISGIISGLALGSKYAGFLCLSILSLGILINGWTFKKENFSLTIKSFLLFTILGISIGSFWYLRAYLMIGGLPRGLQEFLYSFKRLFSMGSFFASPAYALDLSLPHKVFILPWKMTMHPESFHSPYSIGLLFLAFLPFFILPRVRKNSLMKFMLYYSLIFYFFWAISTSIKRFLIPIFPLLSIMVAYIVETLLNSRKNLRTPLYSIIFLTLAFNIFYLSPVGLNKIHQQVLVLMGVKSQEEYILENEETYRVFKYINENLPPKAKIYVLNDPRTFYCDRDYVTAIWKGKKRLDYSSLDDEEIFAMFKQAGLTHLVVHKWLLKMGYGKRRLNRLSEEFKKDHLKIIYEHYPYIVYKIDYKIDYPFQSFDKKKILSIHDVKVSPQKAKGENMIYLYWNGCIKLPGMIFKPGKYKIDMLCRGSKCDNIGPIIRFKGLIYDSVSYFKREILLEREVKNLDWEWIEFPLDINKEEKLILEFSFINDGGNLVTKEDRNFYLKQLRIMKVLSPDKMKKL